MNETAESPIGEQIDKAVKNGDVLRYALEVIAEASGFSLPQLVQKGAICADVEYGQEGYALLPFHPKFLILGEAPSQSTKREKLISGALAAFSEPPVTVKRTCPQDLLKDLDREGTVHDVGLITWLNIFFEYEDSDGGEFVHFATSSEKLLARGGRVVMSLIENDESRQKMIDTVIRQGIPGLRLSKLVGLRGATDTGNLILIGEKLG